MQFYFYFSLATKLSNAECKKKFHILCYLYHVKKQFYSIVLTVLSTASVDRVRRSILSDGSL